MSVITLLLAGGALAEPRGVESIAPEEVSEGELARTFATRRVALVVGLNEYMDPALQDLRYATRDAEAMAAMLEDPSRGGFDEVHRLTGPLTREGFDAAFNAVTAGLEQEDIFLLYYSGHGTLALSPVPEPYLLLGDGYLADPGGTGVSVSALEQDLGRLRARRRVMVVDACHSYSGTTRDWLDGLKGAAPTGGSALTEAEVRLFSAAHGQPAQEREELEHGVYTHFLLQAMSGEGDADGDGLVEVEEAHDWAALQTMDYTSSLQVPYRESEETGRESIYLTGEGAVRAARERSHRVWLDNLPGDSGLEVDGVQWRGGSLSPGVHTLAMGSRQITVELIGGETLDVAEAFEAPRWFLAGGVGWSHDPEGRVVVPWSWQGALWSVASPWQWSVRFTEYYGEQPETDPDLKQIGIANVSAARVWGERFAIGLGGGGGVMWHISPTLRASGVVTPMVVLRARHESLAVQLEPAADVVFTTEGPLVFPAVRLNTGVVW